MGKKEIPQQLAKEYESAFPTLEYASKEIKNLEFGTF